MIKGWEEYTHELTPFEKNTLLPLVVESWSKKQLGEIVNMKDMIDGMNKYLEKENILVGKKVKRVAKVTGPRMRKIIHHIRITGVVSNLIATSKGYFLTDKKEELLNFIKSCDQRASSFDQIASAMRANNNLNLI